MIRTAALNQQRKRDIRGAGAHSSANCWGGSAGPLRAREPQGFGVGKKDAGAHPGVTSCAVFSSSLGTMLLWFLSPELSAELRQRHKLVLLASRSSASPLTTALASSTGYSDLRANVPLPGKGMRFGPIFKPGTPLHPQATT